MSELEEYKNALAREFAILNEMDASLAESVVNAGPTSQFINECIAKGLSAKDATIGLNHYQISYMKKLLNNETDVKVTEY